MNDKFTGSRARDGGKWAEKQKDVIKFGRKANISKQKFIKTI